MPDASALEIIKGWGPAQFVAVLFCVVCTVCLLVIRIRACSRASPSQSLRDAALLMASPVTAVLFSITRTANATAINMRGGIDAEYALLYGLPETALICGIAFFCFMTGVIAVSLPRKPYANAT